MNTNHLIGMGLGVALLFAGMGNALAQDAKDAPSKEASATVAEQAEAKCRALDPKDIKNVMAEVENKSSVRCSTALMDALRAKLCTKENKGKKFEYIVNSDHVISNKKVKDRNTWLTCYTVKAP